MPILEIRRPSGKKETRELVAGTPLLIGQQGMCDIRVQAEGVAPVHCRISTGKMGFEVAAATPAGVWRNGKMISSARMKPGDMLRVGDVEIVFDPPQPRPTDVSEDLEVVSMDTIPSPEASERSGSSERRGRQERPPVEEEVFDDGPQLDGLLEDEEGDQRPAPVLLPRLTSSDAIASRRDEEPEPATDKESSRRARRSEDAPRGPRWWLKLTGRLGARPMRPGEEAVTKSPMVMMLLGGAVFMALLAGIIWFILAREATEKEFRLAMEAKEQGSFIQAIKQFEEFLQAHPGHSHANEAKLALATAKVEQFTSGASPNWEEGLTGLNEYITQYRDSEEFKDDQSPPRAFLSKTSSDLALGASKAALTVRKRDLMTIITEAGKLAEMYRPDDDTKKQFLEELATATRAAEAAVLEQETLDAALLKIDEAVTAADPVPALDARRRLLDRYPNLATHRDLTKRLEKVLKLEMDRVKRDEAVQAAETKDREQAAVPTVTLMRRTRSRSDEVTAGRTVFTLAQDSCFGFDSVTGDPRWRRPIGLDTPFFPIAVNTTVPALLMCDSRNNDLLLVHQHTGALVWRQSLGEAPSGAPLVHEGQVFLPTTGGKLFQLDLDSGKIHARLTFPQKLASTPVLSESKNHLYVAGHQAVLYVLTRRPLACETVLDVGHAPGSLQAPLVAMGRYILISENDRLNSTRLRILDTQPKEERPTPVGEARIDGQTREAAVVRGKQLFVPAGDERIAAFTVSEGDPQKVLNAVAAFQSPKPQGGRMFLATGPDDQFWMASSSLRKFKLMTDRIAPDKESMSLGVSSQPVQTIGNSLFVGRRALFSRAVFFTSVDREKMTGQWQAVTGGRILECTGPSPTDGSVVCITEAGDLFRIAADKLPTAGNTFELQSIGQLNPPEGLTDGLQTLRLADGRVAVHCDGPEPHFWVVNTEGNISLNRTLDAKLPLQSHPLPLSGGWVMPIPGRLQIAAKSGTKSFEDFLAPVGGKDPLRWLQLAGVDDKQLVVLTENSRLARLQVRTDPVPHLAEASQVSIGNPVDVPFIIDRGKILLTDAKGRVLLLDSASLETQAEIQLDKPASQTPWLVNDRLLIESGREQLVCCDPANKLAADWKLPLGGVSLSGAPVLRNGQLVMALRDGQVWQIDPKSGEKLATSHVGQAVAFGPRSLGDAVFVGTLDGSLLAIQSLLGGK
ncbi:MAG: PQQ-binding-like beta-propeller repeat protein [Planctomycetales bacterium]|nr:PQQ-binding-like beta-propeller repeat protein [Planctomycetales bacterium]